MLSDPSVQAACALPCGVFSKVRHENFNCLEVTGIVGRSLLGIPYVVVFAHSRHIQRGVRLDHPHQRQAAQSAAEWAKG
jgi:hypothetical protein